MVDRPSSRGNPSAREIEECDESNSPGGDGGGCDPVCRLARADIYALTNGGQIQGEVVSSPDTARDKIVIRTASGGEVTIAKSQIRQITPQSAAELEYERIRPTYPDTVAGQWDLAEWCRDHSLAKQRRTHLERVVALDPNHKKARAALDYVMIEGKWVRPDDLMRDRGYVKYKGAWKLPQEVELLERRRKVELAQRDWFAKLEALAEQRRCPSRRRRHTGAINCSR